MPAIKVIIDGVLGEMDESLLEKRESVVDNEDEHTTAVEYWLDGELVHRSAHVTLKKLPPMFGEASNF